MEEETIKLKKSTLWKVSTGVLVILFIVSLFTGGFGEIFNEDTGSSIKSPTNPTPNPSPSFPNARAVQVSEDDDPFLGDENAPVVMVEFSDFQCPFCRSFWSNTLPSIKSQYIDTGKVKFVYRDFPLSSIHPGAQPAAEAAECARDQNKFWEMHDKIFEEQDKLGPGTQQFGVTELKKWASDLRLDTKEFNNCLDSGKYREEVLKDLNDATSSGGQGTPYFVINGIPVSGAQPFTAFQQVIESQLN